MTKVKICPFCEKPVLGFWKAKTRDRDPCCKQCLPFYNQKYEETKNTKTSSSSGKTESKSVSGQARYSSIKQKARKPTGELKIFLEIFAERKGVCEVTGQQIPFNVSNMSHILSKGAYPRYRLNKANIIHVHPDVHNYYDNSSKEELLKHYPNAEIIYERKEELKKQYYSENKIPTFGK